MKWSQNFTKEEKREYYRWWFKKNEVKRKKQHLINVREREKAEALDPSLKVARLRRDAKAKGNPFKKSTYQYTAVGSWRIRHPDRIKAHRIVFVAKRNGTLLQRPCEKCGALKSEAHHEDYSKPLDVMWLCKEHHAEADVALRKRMK